MFHYHVELPEGKHLNNIPKIDDWVSPRQPNSIHVRHIVLVEFLSSQADRLDVKPATSCWPWKKLSSKGPKEGVLLELGLTTLPFIKGTCEVPDIRKIQWRYLGLCKACVIHKVHGSYYCGFWRDLPLKKHELMGHPGIMADHRIVNTLKEGETLTSYSIPSKATIPNKGSA